MNKPMLAIFGAGAILALASSAQAAGGCGPGFHRGPDGGCLPNGRPGVVVAPGEVAVGVGGPAVAVGVPAVGVFYADRGYWDGNRYWGHRYWSHGGWRYR